MKDELPFLNVNLYAQVIIFGFSSVKIKLCMKKNQKFVLQTFYGVG